MQYIVNGVIAIPNIFVLAKGEIHVKCDIFAFVPMKSLFLLNTKFSFSRVFDVYQVLHLFKFLLESFRNFAWRRNFTFAQFF